MNEFQRIKQWLTEMGHTALGLLVERQMNVMQDMAKTLESMYIDYCFLGGAVLPFYDYAITTDDVDVLVPGSKERMIDDVIRKRFMRVEEMRDGTPKWYWKDSHVAVGFVYSGRSYRRGGFEFPEPKEISREESGLKIITLPRLIMHKLDSGRSPLREKDLGHVNALIKANSLPRSYAKLHNFPKDLKKDYERRWELIQQHQATI